MYKLLTGTNDETVSGFVGDEAEKDNQPKVDHGAVKKSHTEMMIKMSNQFGFVIDLEKTIYRFKLKLTFFKENHNDRALCRAGALIADAVLTIKDAVRCIRIIDPSNDNRIIYKL